MRCNSAAGVRDRDTNLVDAESIESAAAPMLTDFVHASVQTATLVYVEGAPTCNRLDGTNAGV